jgi:HEAT repeat protein
MNHVFISYMREDLDFAENVISRLEKEGLSTWADKRLHAGEDWRMMIDLAIKNSFALIVVMTPEAKASEYVTYEWAFAWGIGIKVIPLMLRKTPLHPRLEAFQYLDFTSPTVRPWDKLFEEVRAASQTPLSNTIAIPLNSPPFIRQAVAALDSAMKSDREAAIQTLAQTNDPTISTILREALRHPIADVRQGAASALGQIKDADAVPSLIEALHDSNSDVRQRAASALQQIGRYDTVSIFIRALQELYSDVRQAAATALGQLGDTLAIQALVETLHDDQSFVRQAAATALGQLEDTRAVSALAEALHDSDLSTRRIVINILKHRKNEVRAVPILIEALDDPSDGIRRDVAYLLGEIKDTHAVPALARTLNDDHYEVRQAAATALGQIKDARAVPLLASIVSREYDKDVLKSSIDALEYMGNDTALQLLEETANSAQSSSARQLATRALSRIHNRTYKHR